MRFWSHFLKYIKKSKASSWPKQHSKGETQARMWTYFFHWRKFVTVIHGRSFVFVVVWMQLCLLMCMCSFLFNFMHPHVFACMRTYSVSWHWLQGLRWSTVIVIALCYNEQNIIRLQLTIAFINESNYYINSLKTKVIQSNIIYDK